MVTIAPETPYQAEVVALLRESEAFSATYYPPESSHMMDADALSQPNVRFLVARRGGVAVGCGALVLDGGTSAELKRMFVTEAARALRVGQAIFDELERLARTHGVRLLRLETGIHNRAALAMYARNGFTKRGPFGAYRADPLSVFMEKWLSLRSSKPVQEAPSMGRPPLPPFTPETAAQKARMAEDAWNGRDPARVALAYTEDSRWRNRAEMFQGRAAIQAFLTRKWARELDYRLIKEVWAFRDNRIAVRFAYEWHDDSGAWFRSYGNENWEFDAHGLMRLRIASINDLQIAEAERKYHWPLGRRPDDHPGLSELGL